MNKVLKGMIAVACALAMVGCSSGGEDDSQVNSIYKGLDAKETYEKMLEYSNENIHYFKAISKVTRDGKVTSADISEWFKEKEKVSCISISSNFSYNNESKEEFSFHYEIIKDKKEIKYSGHGDKSAYLEPVPSSEESQELSYDMVQGDFFQNVYDKPQQNKFLPDTEYKREVQGIEKEIDGSNIRIIINTKNETTYNKNTEYMTEETFYCISTYSIGKDGLIDIVSYKNYKDETRNTLESELTYDYTDYNKKESFDYNEEVSKMKTLVSENTIGKMQEKYPELKLG